MILSPDEIGKKAPGVLVSTLGRTTAVAYVYAILLSRKHSLLHPAPRFTSIQKMVESR